MALPAQIAARAAARTLAKSNLKTQVIGIEKVLKRFDLSKKGAENGLRIGLTKAALHLLQKSIAIVPVRTAALQKTGKISDITGTKEKMGISVGFGAGNKVDYAIPVHERADLRHKEGKTYKFLERPAKEERKAILDAVAKGISDGIKKAL